MNRKKSLLDYATFDEFNKVTSDFLKNRLSGNPNELKRFFKKQFTRKISRKSYANLSEDEKLFLVLYGYHNFVSKKKDSKGSFNDLLQQFENFRNEDELIKIFGVYLTHLAHKAFLALLEEKEETRENDALLLLNNQLPSDVKKIRIMIPLVPIKSPFTICIISALVDLIRNLSEVEFKIDVGWNNISYRKIIGNMKNHFAFDKQLSFENLQHFIEQNFQTFMYYLILSSQWNSIDEEKTKIEILRKSFQTVKYKLPSSLDDIPGPVAGAERELSDISRIILQDVADYVPDTSPDLIDYYGKIIFDACGKLEDNEHIIFITPLPVGLMTDYLFNYIQTKRLTSDKKYAHACLRVHYLCYLPFPGSEDIRHELPFYLIEYSYIAYKANVELETEKTSSNRDYIRRLLMSTMKKLNLKSDITILDEEKSYKEMISMLTSIFRREDNRQKEYIRYV